MNNILAFVCGNGYTNEDVANDVAKDSLIVIRAYWSNVEL